VREGRRTGGRPERKGEKAGREEEGGDGERRAGKVDGTLTHHSWSGMHGGGNAKVKKSKSDGGTENVCTWKILWRRKFAARESKRTRDVCLRQTISAPLRRIKAPLSQERLLPRLCWSHVGVTNVVGAVAGATRASTAAKALGDGCCCGSDCAAACTCPDCVALCGGVGGADGGSGWSSGAGGADGLAAESGRRRSM
jgi:hypothetical protein